ncbi:hypothetical protein D0868_08958 [Hortaea werneckii]|uniref:Cytochrome P450 n=1 Tax=Hortaea werneckii TaxID=91943 RepID=A0A3M6YCK8_HORWE|nr:hypothetical protein D0868_08958 [Hortaea werneckii]
MSLPRGAYEDIIFNGARIPKGTMILINAQAANHSTEHFGPDADKFNPERWLSSLSQPEETPMSGIQHFSFGAGSRACSGQLIATRLLYTALSPRRLSLRMWIMWTTINSKAHWWQYQGISRCMQQAELRTKDSYY